MLENTDFHENVKIKVTPRAKKTEFAGKMDDGTIKIRLKAVPEDGKANAELLDFLGKNCGGKWELVSGATNTRKIVRKISEK